MSTPDLHIALVSDELTRLSLQPACRITPITPLNAAIKLRLQRPDILLVESAWQGFKHRWKYKIAAYPDVPQRNNLALKKLVSQARDLGIPTVFWNKEDGVHFDRFIESARLFDHVFTVDENAIARYREVMGAQASVHTLMFAIQPAIHYPTFTPPQHAACFIGSYSHHIHPTRQAQMDMLFKATLNVGLDLTVYDRNSNRRAPQYRYPMQEGMTIRPAIPYSQTAAIYRNYLVNLNVNTVQNSPSMMSRRLIEIIGSGGLAVTTPAKSVERYFAPYCHMVSNEEEAESVLLRLATEGHSDQDREMIQEGARYVLRHHSWQQRLQQIMDVISQNGASIAPARAFRGN